MLLGEGIDCQARLLPAIGRDVAVWQSIRGFFYRKPTLANVCFRPIADVREDKINTR